MRDSGRPQSLQSAALWSIALGTLFFLVYGTCNWLTSLRGSVKSFHWAWEQRIPFVPGMVVPYMSLDLFFVGAIFLCRREEIATHAKRVTSAICIASACFLLFPLQFGFARPATGGFSGLLFDWLKLDQPFNQFPSLHITLRSIVWAPFGRRVRGPLRWALIAWFVLIGLSVLLTYQHHVIDVIGGEFLTVIVFYLFPWNVKEETAGTGSFNARATLIYGVPATLLALIAVVLRPWGFLLAWPVCCLVLLSAAYAGTGPRMFRKREGRLSWAATALLLPYLIGSRISQALHHRSTDPWNQLTPNVLFGRLLRGQEASQLADAGVIAVLDLTPECNEAGALRERTYENIQILDWTVPSAPQLHRAVEFIREHSRSGKVYVHCALGVSRSAGVVAAYLLESSRAATAEQAVEAVRKVRPKIVVTPGWMRLLRTLERPTVSVPIAAE